MEFELSRNKEQEKILGILYQALVLIDLKQELDVKQLLMDAYDCDFEDVSSFLFANKDKDIKKIKKEKEILEGFNVNVDDSLTLPDNTKVKYGIKACDTAVFHPLKYLIDAFLQLFSSLM